MTSPFASRFAAAALPVSLRHNGRSITYIDANGSVTTPSVAVIPQDSQKPDGINHRTLDEVVLIEATTSELPNLEEGAAVRVDDGRPYDFDRIVYQGGGMTTAAFIRKSILETGSPTGEL